MCSSDLVRDELMAAFHLPVQQVRVIQPDMGSGYGGKHTGEAAIEAARLAKVVGKPVKVVWTRRDEFTWAYLRPAGLIEIRAGLKRDGTLVAWEHHNYNSGPAAIGTPYNVANQLIQFHPSNSPLRQGSYRLRPPITLPVSRIWMPSLMPCRWTQWNSG